MKKNIIILLFASLSLAAHDIPDRFLGQSVSSAWHSIHGNIKSFFEKREKQPEQKPTLHDLTPFQKLFRQTISFTHNTKNVLSTVAEHILDEVTEKMYSIEQAADAFIARIEDAGEDIMQEILQETLDVDLDELMPCLDRIYTYIHQLKRTAPRLKKAQVLTQINSLMKYLEATQAHAANIQKEGIAQLSVQLASSALSSQKHPLVTSFEHLYGAYPAVVEKINDLKITEAGAIAHSAFNNSSEMVEQVVLLHSSTGSIGRVLIDAPLVHPLDSLKNQIRKLGNALEFVTSTHPVIVVAPPTTTAALMEILKTFVWRGGFSLKEVATEKIERLVGLTSPIKKQVQLLSRRLKNFQQIVAEFKPHLHGRFIAKLKESPLTAIPIAPKVLLDLLEQEIELVKSKLVVIMHASLVLTYRLSDAIALCSSLLGCVNECMGATDDQQFIHRDIIRGIGFVAQDSVGFTNIIINVTEALKEYNPIPFREEFDAVELL